MGRAKNKERPAHTTAFEDALTGAQGWGLRVADIAFIVITLIVAVAIGIGLWVSTRAGATDEGPVAVVQNTEGLYEVLPLSEDTTLVVESALGTNVIEVADGQVRCVEADCSNQVCVNTGWVSEPGQMIVCLPHQLTVEVVANAEDASTLV